MVFFTDGQPTWGERNPQKIMENVKKNANTGNNAHLQLRRRR